MLTFLKCYGGLAGRDPEAIAIGKQEVLNNHNLHYRIRCIEKLTKKGSDAGVPVHAV